jgi:hypothetical protein
MAGNSNEPGRTVTSKLAAISDGENVVTRWAQTGDVQAPGGIDAC